MGTAPNLMNCACDRIVAYVRRSASWATLEQGSAAYAWRPRAGSAERMTLALVKSQTIPRAGLPNDIANAAVYLASDESTCVNGEDIVVDGGLVWGRRFSWVVAGGKAMRCMFE